MPSTITSLAIMGNAVLPDGADAANGNGYVAIATLPDSDGVATGLAFDPTKITLQVADPGYDAAGNPLAVGLGGPTRTIVGTVIMRQQYPNQTGRLNSVNSGTRTVYFALSDFIYAGTVINSVSASAGYYGAAGAGSVAGVVNNSTRAYPKPHFGWLNIPHELSGSTLYVEGVATSRFMRSGRQVACVKYQAKDAQASAGTTPLVIATPALSALLTRGMKPEVYAATLDCSALHQGDLCKVDAWIYPWMGNAPLQLSVGGTAWPTNLPDTQLRFICDNAGTYSGAFAYVSAAALPITASSSFSGLGPANAIDGSVTTEFATDFVGSSAEWLSYDFGASGAVRPRKVRITARSGTNFNQAPASVSLKYSDDGVTFTALETVTFAAWGSANQVQTINVASADLTTHRYWRIEAASDFALAEWQLLDASSVALIPALASQVSRTAATARANPFYSTDAALVALKAFHNNPANCTPSHNDPGGGVVRLMSNGAAATAHDLGASLTTGGAALATIEDDPLNAATATAKLTQICSHGGNVRFRSRFDVNGFYLSGPQAIGVGVVFDGSPAFNDAGGAAPITYKSGGGYFRNVAFGLLSYAFSRFGDSYSNTAMVAGCTNTSGGLNGFGPFWVGNDTIGGSFSLDEIATVTTMNSTAEGAIVYNNRFRRLQVVSYFAQNRGSTKGFTLLQNLFEPNFAGTVVHLMGDSSANDGLNIVVAYNTVPASALAAGIGKFNYLYMDVAGAAGKQKEAVFLFNLIANANIKHDGFTNNTTVTGRTGNWAARRKVGWLGNVFGATEAGETTPDQNAPNNSWTGEGWAPGAVTYTGVLPSFVSNLSGSSGNGGGDYRLLDTEPNAFGRVPIGFGGLSYDLVGTARRTDNTAAAGAFENTSNPPVAGAGGGTLGSVGESGSGKVAVQGGGGGTLGSVGSAGGGGLSPATGTGGGTLGGIAGSGAGEVTSAPITATGAVATTAERMIAVTPVPGGSAASASLPAAAYVWAAPFDPSDRAPYVIDWSKLLATGETIVQIDRISMSAEGASLGLQIDVSAGRSPVISTDGKKTQIWFVCSSGFQANASFSGGGVQVGVSVLIRTSVDPYKQYERTGVLMVRQQ